MMAVEWLTGIETTWPRDHTHHDHVT